MNSISERDSLPERWRVCSDGSSRCASQSANTLQKSSRQQYSAVISTAIEGVSGTGLEAQSSQTDAVKSLIRWESPHPLSIAGVILGSRGSGEILYSVNPRQISVPMSEAVYVQPG